MNKISKVDQKAYLAIGTISSLVLGFLFWLIYFKASNGEQSASWVSSLPATNAFLNSVTTVLLIIGYIFIKKGFKKQHIYSMLLATTTSALFLVSYILYHHFHGDTKFIGQGIVRPIYFFILISHIVLSVIMVPMIFSTLWHAFRKNYLAHKKIARWTFPIWIYVSITGVMIYFFLNCFNQ